MRVRSMQMNDAHIYVPEEQFEQEFMAVIDLYKKYFDLFNIGKYVMRLSLHGKEGLGKKYVDNERLWLKTEDMVRNAMKNGNVPFVEAANEAAFYGPKIDVQIWSAIGQRVHPGHQPGGFCPAGPLRPGLHEQGRGRGDARCASTAPRFRTHERFIGFLLEHYAGNFPVWLSPEHARVIPITDNQNEYAEKVVAATARAGHPRRWQMSAPSA